MNAASDRPLMPYQYLFPLAGLYAVIAVPLWLATGMQETSPATLHGHEMLFGFALAVIAGFLATQKSTALTGGLVIGWLIGRVAVMFGSGFAAMIAGLVFPLSVFIVAVLPLLRAAKRHENRILPVLLSALVCADAAWWLGTTWFGPWLQSTALLVGIDLVALLLLLVGGRALRASAGGHIERRGIARKDRMQPRYELPLALLAGGAAVFDAFSVAFMAGVLSIGAAVLTLVRVIPWQLQLTVSRPAVWSIALGYLWLIPGFAIKGIAQLTGVIPVFESVHAISIGALGTLTLVMMARTALLRTRQPIDELKDIGSAALLISLAALARLVAPLVPTLQNGLLWLAAIAWSCAFMVLLFRLTRTLSSARR